MKKLLLLCCLVSSFAATAQKSQKAKEKEKEKDERKQRYMIPQKDKDCVYISNVTKNTGEDSEAAGTATRLAYRPYEELLTEINALRKMNNWADTTYQRRFNTLPAGGNLVITMYRRGASNADPSLLTITAKNKAGEEVFNQTPAAGTGRFWNRDLYKTERTIPFVKTETPQPLTVIITDAKLQQNFEYVVDPKG